MRKAGADDGNGFALLVQKQDPVSPLDAADLMGGNACFFGGPRYSGSRGLGRGEGDLVIVAAARGEQNSIPIFAPQADQGGRKWYPRRVDDDADVGSLRDV